MKNNTTESKLFLKKALSSLPDDYALWEVRSLMRSTLLKIEQVESKRNKRQDQKEKRESNDLKFQNPFAALKMIDSEIQKSKADLQEIINRKNNTRDDEDKDDGIQTVFG